MWRQRMRSKTHGIGATRWLVAGALLSAAAGSWAAAGGAPAPDFAPPPRSAMPDGGFGRMVRLGEQIFTDTRAHAPAYVGNHLACSNCHLDAGRKAGSAPMWAAWVAYPAFRSKNGHVNTFAERLQGCFRYSMNGKAPPLGGTVLVALESYAYWLARGARVDPGLPGRGYPAVPGPAKAPDYARGERVYKAHCAACHGAHGAGVIASNGKAVFPPLWGPDSFNWGAGMGRVDKAVRFIHANMPLGRAGSLSVQQAWDVALFVDSHERPQDPRFTGSVADTRKRFHDTPMSMYGRTVDGYVLGSKAPPAGGVLRATGSKAKAD